MESGGPGGSHRDSLSMSDYTFNNFELLSVYVRVGEYDEIDRGGHSPEAWGDGVSDSSGGLGDIHRARGSKLTGEALVS